MMSYFKFLLLSTVFLILSACSDDDESKLSPINIVDAENNAELMPLYADYLSCESFVIDNNGKMISVYIDGSILVVADKNDYLGAELILEKFEIKSPSEHKVNDKQYPLELQFYHIDSIGKTIIASVFVIEGEKNEEFQTIIDNLPKKGKPQKIDTSINAYYLFSMGLNYWTYQGSLTNKPYDDDVTWYIMQEPIEISADQIDAIVSTIGKKENKTVELRDRIITKF